jgi:hypothetical protein
MINDKTQYALAPDLYSLHLTMLKGIVSRDFVFFDKSEVPTVAEHGRLLIKFYFHVKFFDFCISA